MERSPLFVRLSTDVATDLDDRVRADGRSKQAVVESLLAAQLHGTGDDTTPDPSRATADDIVDLATVAAWLGVEPDAVHERIRRGDFPARRFGGEWRFSRSAITAWMHGTDPVVDRPTGFG